MKRIGNTLLMALMVLALSIPAAAGNPAGPEGGHSRRRGIGRTPLTQVEGRVTAISATSITIHEASGTDVTAAIGPDTVIRHGNRILAPADVAVGTEVHLKLAAVDGGGFLAVDIFVSDSTSDGGSEDHATVVGLVTAIGTNQLTVLTDDGSKTVQVNDSTVIRKGNTTITFSQIVIGDQIEAEGTKVDDTTILASHVHVESPEAESAEISGIVASVGTDSLVVTTDTGAVTVTVTSTTTIMQGHTTIALTDIKVGDQVEAKGTSTDATHLTATSIKDETENETEDENVEFDGTIASIGSNEIVVTTDHGSITVAVSSSTVIVKDHHNVALSDLAVGNRVEVKGTAVDVTHVNATQIKVESGH
jgi:hypothetical protein